MLVTEFTPAGYPQAILGPSTDTGPRTHGAIHLTDILRDIASTVGIGKESGFLEEDLAWFAAGGWLWERVFDMAHQQAIDRGDMVNPGEFTLDGITATPDRVDLARPALIELKCRWRSARTFESLERYYCVELMQIKSYCKMLGLTEADLIIFFVAGDWRPPTPTVRGANLKFTELELDENWAMVVNHARQRGWL